MFSLRLKFAWEVAQPPPEVLADVSPVGHRRPKTRRKTSASDSGTYEPPMSINGQLDYIIYFIKAQGRITWSSLVN